MEGEMNFQGMKRKQLQALCKKHRILANKSNAEMADLLTLTLKANGNSITQGHYELTDESDSMNVPKSKNVKFSPDVEIRVYEPSVYKGRKRRSMVNSGKVNGSPPRARSRLRRTVERNVEQVVLPVVGKKRGRGGEKKGSVSVENVDVTVVTKDGGPQLVKGGDKLSRRQLRSREVVIEENVAGVEGDLVASRKNSKPGVSKKRGNSERSNGIALLDDVSVENVSAEDDAKPANVPLRPRRNARKKETTSLLSVESGKTEIVGRTTRSQAKLEENTSSVTENKAKTFEVQNECQKVLQTEEHLKGVGRYALRRKSFVPQKEVAEEILTEEGVESRKGDGRSRRNARKKDSTSLLSGDFGKTEIVGRTTRSRCSKLKENASSVITNKAETIEIQDEREKVLQLEEPLKDLGRYALRRKSIMPQKGVAVESVSEEGLESEKDVRPSKRNRVKATDSKPIIEVVVSRRTRYGAQVAGNTCAVESADGVTKVNKEHTRVVQLEESMKAQGRNVSRQKSVTAQKGKVECEGPEVNRETRKGSRNSELKAVNKVEASVQSRGETEKARVPIGHLRRSRRNNVMSSSTFATDELGIDEAAGKVGQLKQKRNPMLGEDAAAVAGECLVDKPSRQSAQHASKSDLVGSTVPGKIVEKMEQSITALPVVVEEAMFTEETQIEHTRLIVSKATVDKHNFSLDCCEEVFDTFDKKGSDSKPSEMRRTSFLEVSADFQEGEDTETNLQETSSPTSASLTLFSTSANQEIPKNASQPAVINKEANIVVGDMKKLDADVIPDVAVDDPACRPTEGGADFVNSNSDELGLAELQNNASDMLSLASGFSSANLSDFAGLEKGLERKELGEGIHLESGDVNDVSTEKDKTSALDEGLCDLEKAGLNVTTKKKEHEEAPCDDRASAAAGEEMVSLSTEINLQRDGDVLLTLAAEEKQNFISEKNSGDVSQASRGTCIQELLDGEGTCMSAPEGGTTGSENCSAATASLRFSGIGKQRFFSAANSSVGRNLRHHDDTAWENDKHVMDLEEKEAAADDLPQSSTKELQDKDEDNFAITTDNCVADITGETDVTIHSDSGKASTGVNSLLMLSEELSGYKEMIDRRNCSDATIDVPISKFHEAGMEMDTGRKMDGDSDVEKCETKAEESGCTLETEHGHNSGSQEESEKVNANADSVSTHIMSEGREGYEGKTVNMMPGCSNDFHTSSKAMVSGEIMPSHQCDHVVGNETAKGALLFELCDQRSSEEVAANLNCSVNASLTPTIYKEKEISWGKNVGLGENTSKSIKGTSMWTDQETISVGSDSNGDIASADCKDSEDTSDGVMDAELELGVEAGKLENLKEVNALELERSASIAIENRISMDAIAAFIKENVEKVEDDSKLKHSNIDDEKEYSVVALPQVTPKGMTEHLVEEELLRESNEDCDVVPNDPSKNIEVEAEEAGSVAIGGKICFEKVEDCNKWIERTPISPQILESSKKKAKQTSLEQKLLAELSSVTCRMGSSTDAVSELNVLLSDAGEKYKSHPGSKSIGNEAGGKAMASSDNDASALFTDWEVNLIQGNRERDQVLFTDREVNLIQESDGKALIDNLISNDSEHTAWVEKNVEEVLFTEREVNLIQGSGEQDQVEESDGIASRDNLISNDPLDEHAADDPIRDLKAEDNSYPDIQNTCETGLGAMDNVGTAAAQKMDVLEGVGIRGTSQPVIPAEASHETAKGTLQKTFLSCSKLEESTSADQLVFDDPSCGLTEIISVGSVVQQNGPPAYESGFVQQLYCKDTSSHGGEETTCDHRGSHPSGQGEFHQEDYKVLIAQNVGAEEAREALNDTSLETNPSHPQEVAMEEANEHPDAVNGTALMVGLDCVTQNQQSRQSERESHTIGTEAAHCLHKVDDGVFPEEIVDFGNGIVTSPLNCQRDVDSPAGSSVSASQHHTTENDAWELNLFFGEDKQYENQTSDAWFLHTNLRNEDARKVEENIVVTGTGQAAMQVAEERHGEPGQVMDEQVEEAKHTFLAVSNESNYEDAEASKKQDCVPLEVDSIQDCINCENHENKSVNTEHSDGSAEKEILKDVAEFNACHNTVSSEQRVERDPSYSKQRNNGNLSAEDVGITDLSVDVLSKLDVSILDLSSEIISSAVGQDIAVGGDETRQLKLPLPQATTSCAKEEETHSSEAEQLNTSLVKRKIILTSFVQATPQKMVTCTDMKENLASNKREKRGHMTAPNTLSKRRALEDLRNN